VLAYFDRLSIAGFTGFSVQHFHSVEQCIGRLLLFGPVGNVDIALDIGERLGDQVQYAFSLRRILYGNKGHEFRRIVGTNGLDSPQDFPGRAVVARQTEPAGNPKRTNDQLPARERGCFGI